MSYVINIFIYHHDFIFKVIIMAQNGVRYIKVVANVIGGCSEAINGIINFLKDVTAISNKEVVLAEIFKFEKGFFGRKKAVGNPLVIVSAKLAGQSSDLTIILTLNDVVKSDVKLIAFIQEQKIKLHENRITLLVR